MVALSVAESSYRAYLLKKGLRVSFSLDPTDRSARRAREVDRLAPLPDQAFPQLQRRIVEHKASILAAVEHGLSHGLIESVNTKIRLLPRIAFGFDRPNALTALAMPTLGGHPSILPRRT